MRIAIQGQDGSFHAAVARKWYGQNITLVPCTTFQQVFDTYEQGEADAIVSAVENTIYGSINQVYQLIEDCSAPIIGEIKLPIRQQLIAAPGTSLDAITEVYSHPVALAQCREFIAENLPDAEVIEFFDTAGAVEYVASLDTPGAAAIASEEAAAMYGLPVIQADIHDHEHNITRFLIIEAAATHPEANRSSIVVTTTHKPGALVEVLEVFAAAGVNLAKLQSQPIVGSPWKYKFFIVLDAAGAKLRQLVSQIEASDHNVTLLGEYRRDDS